MSAQRVLKMNSNQCINMKRFYRDASGGGGKWARRGYDTHFSNNHNVNRCLSIGNVLYPGR